MNLVKCPNGHFYDENSFQTCPHCTEASARNDNITMPVNQSSKDVVTSDIHGASGGRALKDAIKAATGDDEKTVGFYKKSIGTEPVVGWLVSVKGAHFGEDFRLKSGRNFIGRASEMDVIIANDSAVSRERHAIVVYEPKGGSFLVMPGESKELCYLNGEVVLTPVDIKHSDILSVGDTDLMFIPCCSPEFNWDDVKKEDN